MPPVDSPGDHPDVASQVDALAQAWHGGDPTDPALRRRVSDELSTLRSLWTRAPECFAADAVATLRSIAAGLRTPPPARPLARPPARPARTETNVSPREVL